MNDFTKEELIYILKKTSKGTMPISEIEKHNLLHEKLQSLIDNYCEHEIYYDYDDCADYCKKCGKKIAVDRRV